MALSLFGKSLLRATGYELKDCFMKKFAKEFAEQYAIDEWDERVGTTTNSPPSIGGMAETLLRKTYRSHFPLEKQAGQTIDLTSVDRMVTANWRNWNVITSDLLGYGYPTGNRQTGANAGTPLFRRKFHTYNMFDNHASFFINQSKRALLKRMLLAMAVSYCIIFNNIEMISVWAAWIDRTVDRMTNAEVSNALAWIQTTRTNDAL